MFDNKPSLLMLVGLPGSGKDTYLKKYFNQNLNIHSSDDIREELSGDVNNQNINQKVFEVLHKRVKEDLKNGISCVYNATNISWKRRKAFLQELSSIDCWKVCHIIATPFEVCLQQNAQRDRKVPYHVIERMYMNFDIPFYNEGWDDIEIWYNDTNYKNAYGHWSKFILDTLEFDQENKYHKETLGDHCRMCADHVLRNVFELQSHNELEAIVAAGLHDCGKPFTKTFKDSKGNASESAHYYNHENVGSYNSLFYTKDSKTDSLLVAALIRWHMALHFFKDWKQSTIDKYEKEFTSNDYLKKVDFYKVLKLINEGDKKAH